MPITTETSQEPIPGYRILERIGAGGYGEVWKAEAPGGLVKALKFVYGRLDEERAARELKSLERIKDVRHPFLLSLERIEIADGRLMIVTELADGSLKDRFDEVVAEGRSGIDREELLTYMRDAADVLDFMSDAHSLQHLDIKPENLLLVGGRIKVADFGLVKKLQDVTASLLGGLTPLYAPPELFEGRPSAWSDQYSLAIVYLEMLTGTLPFAGRTAGQLAKQHLHASPKLGALAPAEQAVLRRALAKRPQDRFESCREFVRMLTVAKEDVSGGSAVVSRSALPATDVATEVQRGKPLSGSGQAKPRSRETQPGAPGRRVPQVRSAGCTDAGPLEVRSAAPLLRPTLWIGLGGCGARVLVELRAQQHTRLGEAELPPCWQYLLIDSDPNELARISAALKGSSDDVDPVLAMPLKKPQSYKQSGRNPARWLSRRWLYHIPKTPATNGLRPLGCLAFVDHVEEFEMRVSEMIQRMTSEAALKESEKVTGWSLDDAVPEVVMIAGLGGGTGGGMLAEAALTLRRILQTEGHSKARITGIAFHAAPRSPQERELATVSSYATLTEVHHAQQGPPDARAFNEVYLHDFGSGLTGDELTSRLHTLATQLAIESTTVASRFKELVRSTDSSCEFAGHTLVRTSGAHAIGPRHGKLVEFVSRQLAGLVVQSWLTGESPQPDSESEGTLRDRVTRTATASASTRSADGSESETKRWVQELCARLELDQATFAARYTSSAEQALGEPMTEFLSAQVAQIANDPDLQGSACKWLESVQQLLDRLLGHDPSETDLSLSREPGLLDAPMEQSRCQLVESIRSELVTELLGAATQPDWRVAGAHSLVQFMRLSLRGQSDALRELQQQSAERISIATTELKSVELPGSKAKRKPLSPQAAVDLLLSLATATWEKYQIQCVLDTYAAIDGCLADTHDELVNVSRELRVVHEAVDPPSEMAEDGLTDPYELVGRRHLSDQMQSMAAELEEAIRHALEEAGQEGAWIGLIQQNPAGRSVLIDGLMQQSRSIVTRTLEQSSLLDDATADDTETMANRLQQWFQQAEGELPPWGGKRRRYLIVPDADQIGPWLEAYYGSEQNLPSVLQGQDPEIIFGSELGVIPISRVAVSIIGSRSDRIEYANRLLCRSDVEYPPLPDESLDDDC